MAFENYLDRLGRALRVARPQLSATALPRPPRTGKLQLDIAGGSLDTLDFMALSGCAVQVTIGKRNNSLGRMARPSQRLLLELEYLRLAPACITYLRTHHKDTLANTLEQSWQRKHHQLPALVFNATLGGEEYRAFWLPTPAPGHYPAVSSSVSVAALAAINQQARRWLAGDYQADNRGFEVLLSEVAGGGGGVLLQSLARQEHWLALADGMLDNSMTRGPLCAANMRHPAADILPNITHRFFIGGIQVQAARMEQRRYALLPPLAALEQQLSAVLPDNYRHWQAERNTRLARATGAPKRHVQQIQRILVPCGNTVT